MNDTGKWLIRPATPDEAQPVFELKRQSFANTTLPFTIYRAPASVRYLKSLIHASGDGGTNPLCVAVSDARVTGYYLASQHDETYFLNYIAVVPDCRRIGIGRALLADFEARGARNGCSRYMLDAVQENARALQWYFAQGYSPIGTYNHVRLRMCIPDKPAPELRWDEGAWSAALTQEAEWGFAKYDAATVDGKLEIGLIDGSICKLLHWDEMRLETAVNAVMGTLTETRSELIISNLAAVPVELSCLQRLEVVRLLKESQ